MKTKQKLIEATIDLAMVQGLGAVSLGDVAENVGIKKPSIYNHFSSKADLIQAVYDTLKLQSPQKEDWFSPSVQAAIVSLNGTEAIAYFVDSFNQIAMNESQVRRHRLLQTEKFFSEDMKRLADFDTAVLIEAVTVLFEQLNESGKLKLDSIETAASGITYALLSIPTPNERIAFCKKFTELLMNAPRQIEKEGAGQALEKKPVKELEKEKDPVKSAGLLWRNRNSEYL